MISTVMPDDELPPPEKPRRGRKPNTTITGRNPNGSTAITGRNPNNTITGRNEGYKSDKGMAQALLAELTEPIFTPREIAQLENLANDATPEEFQKGVAMFFRRMLVKGLGNIPAPRTIKEIQAIADMLRRAEGLERKDKGDSIVVGLVKPRMVSRRSIIDVSESGTGPVTDEPVSGSGPVTDEPVSGSDSGPDEDGPTTPDSDEVDPMDGFEV